VVCRLHVVACELRTTIGHFTRACGFTLLEVLVATTLLFAAVAALAGLSMMATHANTVAKTTTLAALLAAQKMEHLRALTWGYDALGNPRSDAGLTASPADAISQNSAGYYEFLDASGRPLGEGASPPPQAAFVRRWSIQPLPSNPANALVLQVVVKRVRAGASQTNRLLPDEAGLVTVRARTGT
jgi:type II secretory pathway pseudopilin PulG